MLLSRTGQLGQLEWDLRAVISWFLHVAAVFSTLELAAVRASALRRLLAKSRLLTVELNSISIGCLVAQALIKLIEGSA